MRILRLRRGFQADHSSSNYLFYAVDHPVSARGQQIAHRYSSRADVDEHTARYQKWNGDLSSEAYKALLSEHYDVMVSESYDWWELIIAVRKSAETQALLAPFRDARGYDDLGVEVEDYGSRLAAVVYCMFDYGGPAFEYGEDSLEALADLLVEIRTEMLQGNVSFLEAAASFYGAEEHEDESDEEDEAEERARPAPAVSADLSKADLQRECTARGIDFRKSWTKSQLLDALRAAPAVPSASRSAHQGQPAKLSKAARRIIESLDRP
jgi:hypothetical protein